MRAARFAGVAVFALLFAGSWPARLVAARGTPPDPIDRFAPETWNLWRCAPMPFPDRIEPMVPEAVPGNAVEFGTGGADLAIVMPDHLGADYDGRALRAMQRLITEKTPRAAVVAASGISPEIRRRHLLVLGTIANNLFAREILPKNGTDFVGGIEPGGYHVGWIESPAAPGRKIIFALGADDLGAWSAAAMLAYSIHPAQRGLTELKPWPVRLPTGTYWAAFDATCRARDDSISRTTSADRPASPRVPFGVRIWGSPMPTLGSFQRLVRVLRGLGINTIAIQGGGWPDLPDAAERFRTAIDAAWREGIFTILYVGNDMNAHRPAPLTENDRAIVMATKDSPGLLEWHVYNQLAADLTADERRLVEEQVRWLKSVSSKRVGMEIVWGHDTVAIPADKVRLIDDLKRWGVDVIANDDAPIGGWSRKHDVTIWEPRLRELARFGLPVEAVLQAHIPFVEPTLPSATQVRSQFWWAAAGGAKGFLVETAYLFTHLSNRGLLSWDLRPLPDGRADEVRRLAAIARDMSPFFASTAPLSDAAAAAIGLKLNPATAAGMRLFRDSAGKLYALVAARSLDHAVDATIDARNPCRFREIAPSGTLEETGHGECTLHLAAGGGACLEILPIP